MTPVISLIAQPYLFCTPACLSFYGKKRMKQTTATSENDCASQWKKNKFNPFPKLPALEQLSTKFARVISYYNVDAYHYAKFCSDQISFSTHIYAFVDPIYELACCSLLAVKTRITVCTASVYVVSLHTASLML